MNKRAVLLKILVKKKKNSKHNNNKIKETRGKELSRKPSIHASYNPLKDSRPKSEGRGHIGSSINHNDALSSLYFIKCQGSLNTRSIHVEQKSHVGHQF